MRLSEGFSHFARLPAAERGVLVNAAARYLLIMGMLRTSGFQRCAAFAQRAPKIDPIGFEKSDLQAQIDQRVLAIQRAYKALGIGTCLDRALTLCWMLNRSGLSAEVKLGVQKQDDNFGAHAWVECNGKRLGDDGARSAGYAAFDTPAQGLGSR